MENVYVGLRYVPLFDGDWDNTKNYEPLTIVNYQGNSYTSKTYVPSGTSIDNTTFWSITGNYNAQVEAYREETARVQNNLDKKPFVANGSTIPLTVDDYAQLIDDELYEGRKGDFFIKNDDEIYFIGDIVDDSIVWVKVANDSDVSSAIETLESSLQDTIEALEESLQYTTRKGLKIGFFGDSWVLGNDNYGGHYVNNFAKLVSDKIGADVYNYGLGGAGFCRKVGGLDLEGKLDAVHNDPTQPDLDICVVMGGFNDWNHIEDAGETYTAQTINSKAQTYLTKIHTYYPNAKIVWCGMNMKCNYLNANFWSIFDYLNNVPYVVDNSNVVINCQNWVWTLIGKSQYYNNDGVHPAPQGHIIIANAIVQSLFGGQNSYRLLVQQANTSGVFPNASHYSGQYYCEQINDEIVVHFPVFRFSEAQSGTTIQSGITLPEMARPFSTQVVQCYSGSVAFDCVCSIMEDGHIYLKRVSGDSIVANANIYIPDVKYKLYSNKEV